MKILLSLAVLGLSVALSGCGYGSGSSNNTAATPDANKVNSQFATPSLNTASAISIKNFAFNPGSVMIKKGATVTWTNNDSAPHQIKSSVINSSVMNTGEIFSFTFGKSGTYDYICAIHPSMKGTIIVQ